MRLLLRLQVRADLEAAAKLMQKRALKHNDSNSSNASGSTIFMPPPPGQTFAGMARAVSNAARPHICCHETTCL
jgi:hypothetical protein